MKKVYLVRFWDEVAQDWGPEEEVSAAEYVRLENPNPALQWLGPEEPVCVMFHDGSAGVQGRVEEVLEDPPGATGNIRNWYTDSYGIDPPSA